jgi:hypothetical protein
MGALGSCAAAELDHATVAMPTHATRQNRFICPIPENDPGYRAIIVRASLLMANRYQITAF